MIDGFLHDRQTAICLGERSQVYSKSSDVTGASRLCLGPLLFLVYINYLQLALQSYSGVFAGDALLYNAPEKATILQRDIAKLENWSELGK